MSRKSWYQVLFAMLGALLLVACTTYTSQEVPFRPPAAYQGMQMAGGAQVAAEPFVDKKAAKQAFGFDIRGAGLLPVQIVIDNAGKHALEIVPSQTFLIDAQGNYWNLLDSRTAYSRVESSSEFGTIGKGAGKGATLGAAGGALIGAAIGILAGENVGDAAMKGAAAGVAGGAIIGGANAASSEETGRQISRDLANKQLENRAIQPGTLARGFLFFPGEAPSAVQLRLQLVEKNTGVLHNLMLAM
ncbi:lipoprotein [Desulfuromonas versatilis]|uniref:Lipoprotein n=1 Tax=Desulfuromonas versatilis TaxID=2802975 RepID=A0ABM8HU15_9BACT|nr:hypothetical protein [Desulfuromonas versatilis]BCR05474.1 lipoprotein [Desulfuromonas versatilis]